MTHVAPYAIVDAPNYGGRVPVDTTPGPAPVCRALKTHPITPRTAPSGEGQHGMFQSRSRGHARSR